MEFYLSGGFRHRDPPGAEQRLTADRIFGKARSLAIELRRAEQCKQLKEQYDKVLHARRIYQPGGDSSAPKEYMSDAQAEAERVKTRQAMDEACAGGASS